MTQSRKILIYTITGLVIIVAGVYYAYTVYAQTVYVDTASLSAPLITLAPTAPGPLNALYVSEGDRIAANTPVALVGTQVITSKTAGLVVNLANTIGADVPANQAVVTMIEPTALRVVGQVKENNGLSNVRVGEPVIFTVDAYGSQEFHGVIDSIAPTARAQDVVFTISDKRQEQSFDVKARFDAAGLPYLKNGMSARMWIYPNGE